jgi:hypothetical protein
MAGCLHESATSMMYCESCAARLEAKAALVEELVTALKDLRQYCNAGGCWCTAFEHGHECHTSACQHARTAVAKAEALKQGGE